VTQVTPCCALGHIFSKRMRASCQAACVLCGTSPPERTCELGSLAAATLAIAPLLREMINVLKYEGRLDGPLCALPMVAIHIVGDGNS
jgi:hypothetical protein